MYSTREDNIVALSSLYANATGRQISTVGRLCSGDSRLVKRLERHGSLSRRVYIRITQWFCDNWPSDLTWPVDIPRPTPSPDSPAAQTAAAAPETPPGLELNDQGTIANTKAFLEYLGIPRVSPSTLRDVIRFYGDGKSKELAWPLEQSDAERVMEGLITAAKRVAKRAKRQQKYAPAIAKFREAS